MDLKVHPFLRVLFCIVSFSPSIITYVQWNTYVRMRGLKWPPAAKCGLLV